MNYIPLWLVDVAKETLLNRGFNLVRFIEISPHSDRFFLVLYSRTQVGLEIISLSNSKIKNRLRMHVN